MPTIMRFTGLALGMLALAVPLLRGGVIESAELQSCQSGGGMCGDAIGAIAAGGHRIADAF
ncbi:MAG: hypothetical protein R3B97_04515 [Dehalococcoidia bacterium]|nr:hypothetical protein [Dehalococcoidia bacterium]MCB9486441.1 hypothetical protein [Thermoflexaceae bacterium]